MCCALLKPMTASAVLQRLYELYPQMFGARFLPLQLGAYQELLARHPEEFRKEDLKQALGVHARSTRYLECVANGEKRHDLEGRPVGELAHLRNKGGEAPGNEPGADQFQRNTEQSG